jgi:hypothetical protein
LQADTRDVTKGLYQAFLIPDGRGVFFKFPGQVASDLQDNRLVRESEAKGNDYCKLAKNSQSCP